MVAEYHKAELLVRQFLDLNTGVNTTTASNIFNDMVTIHYELDAAEFIGFIGGVVLSVALVPQVMHTLHMQSTKDISYAWQITYIIGLILNYIYFVMVEATAAWLTLTVEMAFALWLLALKIRFDGLTCSDPEEEEEEDEMDQSYRSARSMSMSRSVRGPAGRSTRNIMGNASLRSSLRRAQMDNSARSNSIRGSVGGGSVRRMNRGGETDYTSEDEEYIIGVKKQKDFEGGRQHVVHFSKEIKDEKANNNNTVITMEGDVDLDISVDQLKYKDAVKFKRETAISGDTLVKEAYRGFHIMIDVVFTIKIDEEFGRVLLAKMCELAPPHGVRVVHQHAEIFDGEVSPPGFAVAALLDESHMSAHCYSDQGKLAFDVFTCGANPDGTRKIARDVLAYLKQHLGEDAQYLIHRMPRFPLHRGTNLSFGYA